MHLKSALSKSQEPPRYNYTELLPVFQFQITPTPAEVVSELDLSIAKVTKAINLHSIEAKPKIKSNHQMTAKELAYFNQREFNKHIPAAYLLLGRAHLYKKDYRLARQTFAFMETQFKGEEILLPARLYSALAHAAENDFIEAQRLIKMTEEAVKSDKKNKGLKLLFNLTQADVALKKKDYPRAAEFVDKALLCSPSKNDKLRLTFLLAQLRELTSEPAQAAALYKKVVRMNAPYEMVFNATINSARASMLASSGTSDIKKQLNKMLKDSKNTEYRDQLYFTLGEIELSQNNRAEAVKLFQKSAEVSVNNVPQKLKTYKLLSELFYQDRDYYRAEAYYDSTLRQMNGTEDDFVPVCQRATVLSNLVKNLRTIEHQDSLQRIAKMSQIDRVRYINGMIADLRKRESEARQAEEIRLQQYYANQSKRTSLNDPTRNNTQWYFYNPTTVSQGIGEFQMKWGRRTLEDNWRRKDKGINEDFANQHDEDSGDNNATQNKRKSDVYTVDYYLQDLPLNDSLMRLSNDLILEAYFRSAQIYNDDLQETKLSIEQYEAMLERFKRNDYRAVALYNLHNEYKQINDFANAERVKNLLLKEESDSFYALIIQNPSFLEELSAAAKRVEQLYEAAYEQFTQGNLAAVLEMTDSLNLDDSKPINENLRFIRMLSAGRLAENSLALRESMQEFLEIYPVSKLRPLAENIIAKLDSIEPEIAQIVAEESSKEHFVFDENRPHIFVWAVDERENINQLLFEVLTFNMDISAATPLETNRFPARKRTMIAVKPFQSLHQAQGYMRAFMMNPTIAAAAKYSAEMFLISDENFEALKKLQNVELYMAFFKKNYLRQ